MRETPGRLLAQARINLAALDAFGFASRKTPEYMHWRLVECHRCDIVYANPAPAAEELAALYREAAFAATVESRYASATYGRLLRALVPHWPDRAGALDIGTGDGTFLRELLDAGFSDVLGIEPSAAPIAAADPAIRPLIRQDTFRPESFPEASFRLVSCFQTIEHVPDPLDLARAAWRLLKPGAACSWWGTTGGLCRRCCSA